MLKDLFRQIISPEFDNSVAANSNLEKLYQNEVSKKHLWHDSAQISTVNHLQTLMECMVRYAGFETRPSLQKIFSPAQSQPESLYIYGGVGGGKSMLMDLFFENCPIKQKRRVHFHAFMLEVHAFNHQWRQENDGDPIYPLAKKIRNDFILLCFDEFQVTDITDAMILGRLFGELFSLGIVLVATSNRYPDDLYTGGLQRDLFLPFINILKKNTKVLNLTADRDYRLAHLHALTTTYFCPLGKEADLFLQQSYNEFTNHAPIKPGSLQVLGRELTLSAVHGDIAMTHFEELCERPLGSADYLEISREFSTLLIARIPRLHLDKRNEAKRFVTLIDALYEHKVKLICTAEVPANQLYTEGDGAFEFERTVSRLMEMQSESYMSSGHVSN